VEPRVAGIIAWSLWALALVLAVVGVTFGIQAAGARQDRLVAVVLLCVISIVYPTVGAFVATHQPRNAVAWTLVGAGVSTAVVSATAGYARVSLSTAAGSLPATDIAAWVASWVFVPALALAGAFLLFLFPTGSPSRRWRLATWIAAGGTVASAVGYAFRPGPLAALESVTNPFGVEVVGGLFAILAGAGDVLFPLVAAFGAASMFARYRSAGAEERQQIKWFSYAACIVAVGLLIAALPVGPLVAVGWIAGGIALATLPIAVAIAVMKYRLYDIDLIINRTLAYVGLIGILGGAYAASIALFQRLFIAATGDTSDAAVVITTLILAGLFTPVRRSLEAGVDRRFKPPTGNAASHASGDAPAAISLADLEAALRPVLRRIDALERGSRRRHPARTDPSHADRRDRPST
jgi:hypothetical protein